MFKMIIEKYNFECLVTSETDFFEVCKKNNFELPELLHGYYQDNIKGITVWCLCDPKTHKVFLEELK